MASCLFLSFSRRIDLMSHLLAHCFLVACCLLSGLLSGSMVLVDYSCFDSGEQGIAIASGQACYTQSCGQEPDACGPCEDDDCCEIAARPIQPADHSGSSTTASQQSSMHGCALASCEAGSDPHGAVPAACLRDLTAPPPAEPGFAGFLRPLRA